MLGASDEELRALFAEVGFVDYRSDLRSLVDLHGDVTSLLGWSEASAFGNFLGRFSPAERAAIDAAFAALVEARRTPEGLRLERYLRFAFARKPRSRTLHPPPISPAIASDIRTMSKQRQLALNLFIYPGGHHEAAWRYKGSSADRILDVTFYQELAQRAEASKFDAIFFADGPALADNVRYAQRFRFEPITLLSAIAAATKRIGLIATASTTYTEPYNLARLFASLDHISSGRAGWNIVTTSAPQAAQNFGLPEHPPASRTL